MKTKRSGGSEATFSAKPTAVLLRSGFSRLQVCFLLSGAAGLMYQVAWMKSLGLLFGYTAYAAATAIGVFLAGLALGSFFIARWSQERSDSVRIYAWLEFAIAGTGVLSLAGLFLVRAAYLALHPVLASSSLGLLCLRISGAALVLGIPSFLMGGTFPLLIRGAVCERSDLPGRIGRLYAVNTLGAVLGTFAAGFIALPAVGLRWTVIAAAALNVLAGAIAIRTSSLASAREGRKQTASPSPRHAAAGIDLWTRRLLLAAFAVTGFTAIAYEIAWTRMLATFLGSSTYAFTLMLGTFLLGIVIGSALFEKFLSQSKAVGQTGFAWTQSGISLAALAFLFYFSALPELVPSILRATGNSFAGMVFAQFATCSLAMLPAAIAFGANFPLVVALIAEGERRELASVNVGRAYAFNTAGGIVGAFAAGFVLLPLLGSYRLLAGLGTCNALLAIALLLSERKKKWFAMALNFCAAAALLYVGISGALFSRTVAGFGALLYGNYHDRLTVREIADTEDVLFFQDGLNATISVTRSEEYVALKTNGKVDASNLDTSTQLLLGDLGAVFHPHPKRVLIIGLGGGMTASAVARFPDVEQIDCVEIEPAVLRAQSHLARLNRGVLADSRLRLIFDDARNYLQTTSARYDLIISEPSNPWIAGISALYTREFYAALRRRLEPGGFFVQWIQAYGLAPDDFRMIVASLSPSFADLSLWRSSGRDYLMLARTEPGPFSFKRSRKLWGTPALQEDFRALKLASPESWPAYFRLGDAELRKTATGAPPNTDDHTRLEFEAPKRLLAESLTEELARYLESFSNRPLPGNLLAEDLPLVRLAAGETALELNDLRAAAWLEGIAGTAPPGREEYLRGRLALLEARPKEAEDLLARALNKNTDSITVLYWLSRAEAESGHAPAAAEHLQQILKQRPRDRAALEAMVALSEGQRDWDRAIAYQIRLRDAEGASLASSLCRLGDFYLRKNDLRSAEGPLREGLQHDSYVYLCHRDLGELLRASGRWQEAESELRFVEKHFPEADPKTYASMALLYRAQGKLGEAREVLGKGRRIFPDDALLARMAAH